MTAPDCERDGRQHAGPATTPRPALCDHMRPRRPGRCRKCRYLNFHNSVELTEIAGGIGLPPVGTVAPYPSDDEIAAVLAPPAADGDA